MRYSKKMAGPKFTPNPTIDDQINREQKHANIFSDFHAVDLVDCLAG